MRRGRRQQVNSLVVNHSQDPDGPGEGPRVNKEYRALTRVMIHRLKMREQGYDDGKPYPSLAQVRGRVSYIHQAFPKHAEKLWESLYEMKSVKEAMHYGA